MTPGVDRTQLVGWLAEHAPDLIGEAIDVRLLTGGRSNLTYLLSVDERRYVLRRPPLGHVLATAHNMQREVRVIRALGGTDVPVPAVYAYCADTEIIGAEFFVMEFKDGHSYAHSRDLLPVGSERTRDISIRLVELLAALHVVEPEAVGLEEFGRPQGFAERQVNRWKQQLDLSHSRPLDGAESLYRMLATTIPVDAVSGIVHGDFRLDNVLVDDSDELIALLDWEMSTLGDQTADLAVLLAYRLVAELPGGENFNSASRAPGFIGQDEIVSIYERCTGHDVRDLAFHLGLAMFKIGTILEGINYRYHQGLTVGTSADGVASLAPLVFERGIDCIEGR